MKHRPAHPARWRSIAAIASLVGMGGLLFMRDLVGDDRVGFYLACASPFVLGLVAALGSMETRTRILLLWLSALLSGFVAVVTIMSGVGLVVLDVMLAYLLAAWMLNESEARPSRSRRDATVTGAGSA